MKYSLAIKREILPIDQNDTRTVILNGEKRNEESSAKQYMRFFATAQNDTCNLSF